MLNGRMHVDLKAKPFDPRGVNLIINNRILLASTDGEVWEGDLNIKKLCSVVAEQPMAVPRWQRAYSESTTVM